MKSRITRTGWVVVVWLGMAVVAGAQETPVELEADRKPTIVTNGDCFIKGGTLLTVTQGVIKSGAILVRNGKIAAIGPNLTPPAGIPVIDATGKFVTPGIVDAHSHIALDSVNEGADSITAEVRMKDVLNPQSVSLYRGLSNGVTASLLLHGSANPIGGQSVVVKMKWRHPATDLPVPDAPRMIKFALGENVTRAGFQGDTVRFPATRLGVEATYRRAFAEANKYRAAWDAYAQEKQHDPNAVPPRRDLRLETLADVLKGNIWVQCHCYRADEMLMMLRLSQEFHFHLTFQHGLEAYKLTPEIAQAGVGVSTFADAWAYKIEANEAIPYNAALCARAGIIASVNSDNESGTYRLNLEAANCMKFGGLTENEALRLVTLNPAIQIGIDKRTGSLEPGKDADIAIWDGYPLSVYSRCWLTMVEGETLFTRRDPFGLDGQVTRHDSVPAADSDAYRTPAPPVRPLYAIVGATVHPVSAPDIADGTVIIENGKIRAVGKNIAIPHGAFIVKARGLHVYPGLIDAGSELGLSEVSSTRTTVDTNEGGEYQPDLLAATGVHPASEHLPIARNNGITATLTRPLGGAVAGQCSLIDLAGWTPELMTVKPRVALHVNYPEGARAFGRFDASLLPPEVLQNAKDREKLQVKQLHDFFAQAKRYAIAKAQNAPGLVSDTRLDAMIPYVTGKLPVLFNVASAYGVRKAIAFAEEFQLKPIIGGAEEAWKVADLLAKNHIPYIYNIPTDNSLGSTAPAKDYDPTDTVYSIPALMQKAGVKFCIETGEAAQAKNLARQTGITCAYGLSHEAAIKALTLNAAEILGVAGQMGSLEAGKLANVIVTDGDPLEITTSLRYLFIAGKPLPLTSKHTQLYDTYRQRLSEIPTSVRAKTATLTPGPSPSSASQGAGRHSG